MPDRADPRRHRLRRGDHRGRRDLGVRARLRLRQQRHGRAVHSPGGDRGPARRAARPQARLPLSAGPALPRRLPEAGDRDARAHRLPDRSAAAVARQPDRSPRSRTRSPGPGRAASSTSAPTTARTTTSAARPQGHGDLKAARGRCSAGTNPAQPDGNGAPPKEEQREGQPAVANCMPVGAARHLAPAAPRGGSVGDRRAPGRTRTSPPRPACCARAGSRPASKPT